MKLFAVFVTTIFIAALAAIMALATKHVVDYFAVGGDTGKMFFWLTVAVVGVVLRGGIEIWNRQIMVSIHARIEQNVRLDLYEVIHNNSMDFHSHIRTGELANLMGNDVQHAAGGVVEVYSVVWQYPAVMLCLLGVMFYFNPLLSLMGIILFPLLGWCIGIVGRRARNAERMFMEKQGQMVGMMVESLTNIRQVKAFGQEPRQRSVLSVKCEELIVCVKKVVLLKSVVWPVAEILSGMAIAGMAVIAYYQLENGTTSPGAIAGCLAATIALKKPTKAISSTLVGLQRSFSAIHRIVWAGGFDESDRQLNSLNGSIENITLENVVFSYDGR
ncbi:MAG: hypothetical protein KAH23_01465, partial [Kiritimatiellae bacterium]|nr:hypothetical protein [Kiritimatiellia bacterium]